MSDQNRLTDHSETPEDVASLYSWANLHGAKYRDFSASRAQSRESARLRAEQAEEEARLRVQNEAEAHRQAAEMQRKAEEAEAVRQAERQAAFEAGQRAAQQSAQQSAMEEAARKAAREAAALSSAPTASSSSSVEAARQAVLDQFTQQTLAQQALRQAFAPVSPHAAPVFSPAPAAAPAPAYPSAPAVAPAASAMFAPASAPSFGGEPPQPPPGLHGEPVLQPQDRWAPSEPLRESPLRPAWLSPEVSVSEPSSAQPIPQAPRGTLQDSRDRVTSRWFALKGVFDGAAAPSSASPLVEASPAQSPARAPLLAIFSLAGGVGKTTLAATLGRALSAKGERVLLVDTASFGLLPFYFGAREQRVGVLRTFGPPGEEASVQMVALEPETMGPESAAQEMLSSEIQRFSQGANRVIVDLSTASGSTTRRILRLAPTVLTPLSPDMNSVVSVASIDSFFQHNVGPNGKPSLPYYVLNQFDPSLPLHLDVREVLREQVGDRLLPFALRRSPAVSEALAEGMTVLDYEPDSPIAEDFSALANWLKNLAAPVSHGYRGVRWSER